MDKQVTLESKNKIRVQEKSEGEAGLPEVTQEEPPRLILSRF